MKDTWKDLEDIWNSDDYRHRSLGTVFSEDARLVGLLRRRWLWQGGVTVILFFVLLGIFQMEGPTAAVMQENIRYTLAARESDLTPVLETMTRLGLWLDPFDNQVMQKGRQQPGTPDDYLLAIPVSGKAARGFGSQRSPIDNSQVFHSGIDILAGAGAAVRSTLHGTVIRVEQDPYLGRVVELQHEGELTSMYGNLQEILVELGQKVEQGQIIGKAGGNAGSHANTIHFEVREKGVAFDPLTRMANAKTNI